MGNKNGNNNNESSESEEIDEKQINLPSFKYGDDFVMVSISPRLYIDYNGCMKMVIINSYLIFCGIVEGITDNIMIYRIHLNQIKQFAKNKDAIKNEIQYEPTNIIKTNTASKQEIEQHKMMMIHNPMFASQHRSWNYCIGLTSTNPLYIAFPTKTNKCAVMKLSFNQKHQQRNRAKRRTFKGNGDIIWHIMFYVNIKNKQMLAFSASHPLQIFIVDFMNNSVLLTFDINHCNGRSCFDICNMPNNKMRLICGSQKSLFTVDFNDELQSAEQEAVEHKLDLNISNIKRCKFLQIENIFLFMRQLFIVYWNIKQEMNLS